MPTQYIIKASNIQPVSKNTGEEIDGHVQVALSRATRLGALEAIDVLLDAFGENTEINLTWEPCPLNSVIEGTFEGDDVRPKVE